MGEPAAVEAPADRPEPVTWVELFFDLVVVAAVAVLTEGFLEEPGIGSLGMTAVLYGTIWLGWVMVVLYTNVAAERTRVRAIVVAMFLIAVMAATVPLHHPERANLFTIAFLVLRGLVSGSSMRAGRLLTSWPLLQVGGAMTPWIVSLWIDAPGKYYWWAAGLTLDLVVALLRGGVTDRDLRAMTDRNGRQGDRARSGGPRGLRRGRRSAGAGGDRRRGDRGDDGRSVPSLVAVDVDRTHLDERLGVFVIIVLGESVSQLVLAASTSDWTGHFEITAASGFVLLLGLWWLTFVYGFSGAPHTRFVDLPPRFGLPLHLLSTIALVGVAAGLHELLRGNDELPVSVRWVLCAGLSLHFAVGTIGGLAGNATRSWVGFWGVASVLFTLLLGAFGEALDTAVLGWLLIVPVAWQVVYGLRARNRAGQATDQH